MVFERERFKIAFHTESPIKIAKDESITANITVANLIKAEINSEFSGAAAA